MIDSIVGAAAQDLLSTSERADQAFIEELNSEKARKAYDPPYTTLLDLGGLSAKPETIYNDSVLSKTEQSEVQDGQGR